MVFGLNSPPFQVATILSNSGYLHDSQEGVRRSVIAKFGDLPVSINENNKTVHDLLMNAVRMSGHKSFLGTHMEPAAPYSWISFKEVYDRVCAFGSGLINMCDVNRNGSEKFIGICGKNCVEWVVTEFACAAYGFVAVPLYDTLGDKSLLHICNHSGLTVCLCVSPAMAEKLINLKPTHLKHIILAQSDLETLNRLHELSKGDIKIHTYETIVSKGQENPHIPKPSGENDMFSLCYTSGTTGTPKGVIITNKMLVSSVSGAMLHGNRNIFTESDTYLSYLPLAHIYEQFNLMIALNARGKVGFYSGDITKFQEDMYALQPTVLFAVPRVLARIQQVVNKKVADSKLKTKLMKIGIKQKLKTVNRQKYSRSSIWDMLIFNKIRKSFGGRIRMVNVGGAPISAELLQFTRAVFCCPVFEGYGATETCGAITCALFGDLNGCHVGPPLPGCEIKLADVPEMNLNAIKDNRGEICCRGAVTTPGYYKQPDQTTALIDKDGWLHMGDIGEWTESHQLKIVDRLKHIFKLSQGEYIAPEKIEQVYLQSNLINQVFVDGSSLKSYPIALIVPDGETLCKALNHLDSKQELIRKLTRRNSKGDVENANPTKKYELHGEMVSMEDLCNKPDAEKIMLEELSKLGKLAELKGFEQVRVIKLIPEAFSIENGLLTPTLKCARFAIRKRYQEELNQLYSRKELD